MTRRATGNNEQVPRFPSQKEINSRFLNRVSGPGGFSPRLDLRQMRIYQRKQQYIDLSDLTEDNDEYSVEYVCSCLGKL